MRVDTALLRVIVAVIALREIVSIAVLGVAGLFALPAVAQVAVAPELRVDRPTRSMKDLREQNLVMQRFDFSCGAAALATILRYGFDDSVTERLVLEELFGLLSDDEQPLVRAEGFSLLHLQRVAQARGYRAQGFRLEPQQLPMLGGPVIVFIEPRGYRHFAVLRGIRGDRVYLADPSRGNIRMPVYTFLESWLQEDGNGIIFVVEPAGGLPGTSMPLTLADVMPLPPEQLSAHELLAVGALSSRLPEPRR